MIRFQVNTALLFIDPSSEVFEGMMDRSSEKSGDVSGGTTEFEIDKGQSAPKSKMKQKEMKPPEITPYSKVHWRNQDSHPPLPSVLVSDKGGILCSLCPRLSRLSCLSCNKSHYCSVKCKRDDESSHFDLCTHESQVVPESTPTILPAPSECSEGCEYHVNSLSLDLEGDHPNPYNLHRLEQMFLKIEAMENSREKVFLGLVLGVKIAPCVKIN